MQSCLLEATDAVLPESIHGEDQDTLFAIARADTKGATAIVGRLREHTTAQLRRIETLNCSMEVSMCTFENHPGPSIESRIAAMTELLQQKLQSGRATMTDTKVKKVFIVEDDDDLRTAMSLRLRDDFAISVAQDGTSALVRARADRPDAILLDLGLPCGDGLSVLQNLSTSPELRDIPVLVLTGRDGEKSQNQAMASGAWATSTSRSITTCW